MQSNSNATQKRRRVSFCNDALQIRLPVAATETCDIPSEQLWYTKAELSLIKREVGSVLIRRAIAKTKQHAEDEHDDPALWGLERHGLEQHHTKKTTIKLILLAQNMKESKSDPEFLRNVSLHCSRKAQSLASEQGFRDSCHVYYEDSLEKLVDDCIFDCSIPSICGCKRSPPTATFPLAEDHGRRVRSRVSAA